jgi:hypothetical protein
MSVAKSNWSAGWGFCQVVDRGQSGRHSDTVLPKPITNGNMLYIVL